MARVLLTLVLAAATLVASAQQPALRSGIDLTSIDARVRPQDDLYRHVNAGWLARTEIPAERAWYASFIELADRIDSDIRTLIEELAATGTAPPGSTSQQVRDLYASLMDEDRLEQLGVTPIKAELDRIDAIRTSEQLAAETGYLSAIGTSGPFPGLVAADVRNPRAVAVYVSQGGTLLPDREYYLSKEPSFSVARAEYEKYLVRIFTLTGRPNAAADAKAVLDLETALARAHWTRAESRDPLRTYNPYTLAQMAADMPGFDWRAWAKPQGIDRATGLIVEQPSFFKTFAAMVKTTPLDTWKAWLAARHITALSPFLTRALGDARFDFFGRVLLGQEVPRTRWRRAVSLVNTHLGQAVGQLYVRRYFPPAAKTRLRDLVDHLIEAWRDAIAGADWLAPATKREALAKLSALSMKIGYPERWRDYGRLVIKPDDLVGNIQRAQRFENDYRIAWLGRPADRDDWLVTPQTINAYYHPALNEVVFPAALLQPPFFDAAADAAVNYGAIGAVIGHEIGHAFDDRGRRFDSKGAIRDWWMPADDTEYRRRTKRLVEQFNAYTPLPGLHIDGTLTLGENLGDLVGLSIAHRAYQLSLDGKPAPLIDGFTGNQRFFLGWAQVWRSKERDGYLRQLLLSNPHAPAEYRANGPLSHIPAFYDAFGVKPGDKLYLDPSKRVVIW